MVRRCRPGAPADMSKDTGTMRSVLISSKRNILSGVARISETWPVLASACPVRTQSSQGLNPSVHEQMLKHDRSGGHGASSQACSTSLVQRCRHQPNPSTAHQTQHDGKNTIQDLTASLHLITLVRTDCLGVRPEQTPVFNGWSSIAQGGACNSSHPEILTTCAFFLHEPGVSDPGSLAGSSNVSPPRSRNRPEVRSLGVWTQFRDLSEVPLG